MGHAPFDRGVVHVRFYIVGMFVNAIKERGDKKKDKGDENARAMRLVIENAGFIALRSCLCSVPVMVSSP